MKIFFSRFATKLTNNFTRHAKDIGLFVFLYDAVCGLSVETKAQHE